MRIGLKLDKNATMTVAEMRKLLAQTLSKLKGEDMITVFFFQAKIEPKS